MQNGYYWYFSDDGDQGDLDYGEPRIVEVYSWKGGQEIAVCGCVIEYSLEDAHGKFVGPLVPPVRI